MVCSRSGKTIDTPDWLKMIDNNFSIMQTLAWSVITSLLRVISSNIDHSKDM